MVTFLKPRRPSARNLLCLLQYVRANAVARVKTSGMLLDQFQTRRNIKTVIRLRPTNTKTKCCLFSKSMNELLFMHPDGQIMEFSYDRVLKQTSTQADVFSQVSGIVQAALGGQHGSVLTYGQTGGGKTHTLIGEVFDPLLKGIIPRAAHQIFQHIKASTESGLDIKVEISAVEIYCERIRDLLCLSQTSDNLSVHQVVIKWLEGVTTADPRTADQNREEGMLVAGAKRIAVTTEDELLFVIKQALANRVVATTSMNSSSSRSHCLIFLHIHQAAKLEPYRKQAGKLCLVDLAGSERQERTQATGLTSEEGRLINKGLSALGNVVNALSEHKKASHIPYRDSKLTRVLQDSIGGSSATAVIVCCSPSTKDAAESLAALRFATRAAGIVNSEQIKAYRPEKVGPETAKHLQEQLDAALDEVAKLKKVCQEREQQLGKLQMPENGGADTQSTQGQEDQEALAEDVSSTLRSLWLIGVICIAILHILLE